MATPVDNTTIKQLGAGGKATGVAAVPDTAQAAATPVDNTQVKGMECPQLEPLLQRAPELREPLGCGNAVDVQPTLDTCKGIQDQIIAAIQGDLASCQDACRLTAAECESCVRGVMQRHQDQINAIAAKCAGKIRGNLDDVLNGVVASMSTIGIPPPTDTQLTAAAAGMPIPPAEPPPSPDDLAGQVQGIIDGIPVHPPKAIPPDVVPPQLQPPAVQPPQPVGIRPPTVCPPGTVALGDGSCSQLPPANPPSGPPAGFTCPPPHSYYAGPVLGTGTISFTPRAIVNPLLGTTDWVCDAQTTYSGGTGPQQPPSPPPPQPPAPTCPQCGTGYSWGTDANGNPACVPNCQCPICPPPPPPPPGPPPPPPQAPAPEMPPQGTALCGPSGTNTIEAFVSILAGITIPDLSKGCDYGLADWAKDTIVGGFNPFSSGGNKPGFIGSAFNSLQCLASWCMDNIVKPYFPTADCNIPASIGAAYTAFIPRLVQKIFGVIPRVIEGTLQQHENYVCQWMIPSVPELNAARLRNWLSDDEWRFGVKMNGYCVPWQEKMLDSAKSRITIRDAYRLNKLGQLSDDDFKRAWLEQGIDWDRDSSTWQDSIKQYPPMGDLIRMMVRDVGDQQVIDKFDLSAEFTDKWQGDIAQWGESQGVDDSIALKYWQAHWQAPSPRDIFTWLQRLRSDDRDPDDPFASITMTVDDAKRFLQIADYVPGLVDYYVAASYRPLSRVDIRRMYRVGVLKDEDALRRAYKDLGSNDQNARRLAQFTVRTEAPAKAKLEGFRSQQDIMRDYVDGVIDTEAGARQLIDAGISAESAGQILQSGDDKRESNYRRKVMRALQKRYFMGEFTQPDVVQQLQSFGIDNDFAPMLAAQWEQERRARSKHPALAALCKMFEKGLIQMDEYMQRVRNLNYPEADALLLIEQCTIGIKERQAAALEKEYERQKRAQRQQAADARRLARELAPCRVVKPVCGNGKASKK